MTLLTKPERALTTPSIESFVESAVEVAGSNDNRGNDEAATRQRRLRAIGLALDEFRRLSPTMPVAQIQAFVLVALDERVGMTDVAELTGIKPSTASRYLLDLGIARTALDNSFGLLDRGVDPMNTRKARYTLTRKGKALIARLAKLCEGLED